MATKRKKAGAAKAGAKRKAGAGRKAAKKAAAPTRRTRSMVSGKVLRQARKGMNPKSRVAKAIRATGIGAGFLQLPRGAGGKVANVGGGADHS
jgi:hypothetical protein